MRHAKAEQSAVLADIDRPLTDRGRADATAAGAWLAGAEIAPDYVLCSPSIRTRETWHRVAIGLADHAGAADTVSPTVVYQRDLYYSGLSASLDLIRQAPAEVRTILLIGHNPTVSALSSRLDETAARESSELATSGIAVHTVSTQWAGCVAATLRGNHTARGTR